MLLDNVRTGLQKLKAQVISAAFDLRNEKSVAEFVENITATFGRIDVLINNASVLGSRVPIDSYPVGIWRDVVDVNVNGTFILTKHALPLMIQQKSGSIINVSSSVGRKGRRNWGAYAVSKFAIEGFTQTLAEEVKDFGIRVNSLNPGAMATDMRLEAYPDEDQSKLKKPEEILDIFFYLASDESKEITGQAY
ncbi:MAG: SDR family NAD(P)-dependent oxidoreductase [Bacteroidota bacterium]|nr:SDR family NAD(P)-dependent oxidoreductase [Bacteroidota bacterium]